MKVYKVENATLEGRKAGPAGTIVDQAYLDFRDDDLVVIDKDQYLWDTAEGVVIATRIPDRLPQELDFRSLRLVGKGFKWA